MRYLMWLVIGFVSGCAVGIWLFGGPLLAACACMALVAGVLAYRLGSPGLKRKILGLVCMGSCVGMLWLLAYDALTLSVPRKYDDKLVFVEIRASDYGYLTAYGAAGEGEIYLEGKPCQVKYYINTPQKLKPGDRIQGEFTLRYTGIRGEKSPTYHQGKGIYLLAYPKGEANIIPAQSVPAKYFAAELRHNILDLLNDCFPEDTAGFAKALLLGDSSTLSLEADKAFQASGIRHIIAVSGLHVSVLFSLIQILFRKRRILTGIVGLPVLLLFAAVAGFTPSIVRACVMHGIMIVASMAKKDYDPPTSLSFAVLVILLWNPLALTAVGFQLSVGCIVGIFLFAKKIAAYFRSHTFLGKAPQGSIAAKLSNWVVQSVSLTIGTMITTLPLSAYYFGNVSLVSVFTNLLTLWLVSICFYGIVLCCVLGALITPLGLALAWVVSWPMRLVTLIAKLFALLPFSAVSTQNVYVFFWLLFAYIMIGTFFATGRRKPFVLVGCIVSVLVLCLGLSFLERATESFRVTVLDVGQGQCVILQSGSECYVVDCGGDYSGSVGDMAAQNLRSQGIDSVDGLILTHFDTDHAGGAQSFLAQMPTDALYIPDAEDHNGILADLQNTNGELLRTVTQTKALPCGTGTVTLFPAEPGTSGNESSLCILFQVENCDILITGDRNNSGEEYLIENYSLPDIEILVVGHHGSSSSTGAALLSATRPNLAVISVGADNSYGHPAEDTLFRLEMFGCVVMRTDESGTITFRG